MTPPKLFRMSSSETIRASRPSWAWVSLYEDDCDPVYAPRPSPRAAPLDPVSLRVEELREYRRQRYAAHNQVVMESSRVRTEEEYIALVQSWIEDALHQEGSA